VDWYRVVKTIKGHRYVYEQRTWREGRHVRTESRYVGRADGDGAGSPSSGRQLPLQGATDEGRGGAEAREFDPALVDQAFVLLTQAVRAKAWAFPWSKLAHKRKYVERNEAIEACIAALGVRTTQDMEGAYYNSDMDILNVPPPEYFKNFREEKATQLYYATFLHELVHWTGAGSRLGRVTGFGGGNTYAREELVAEAGAIILALHFGIAASDLSRHADYFQGWLGRCHDPADALAAARVRAEEAARYIVEHGFNTTGQDGGGVV
jgi:Zincin-like metallopeptidase